VKLSDFIAAHMDEILVEWDRYARKMKPAADDMDGKELRDHAEQMLREIADEIDRPTVQSEEQENTQILASDGTGTSAAAKHGELRQESNFTLQQVSAEFRSLRATVLRMWLPHVDLTAEGLESMVCFNEAIDRSLADSIVTYSARAAEDRDLFIAILGHDLRGPLATLSMTGGLLVDPRVGGGKMMEIGNSVSRATRQMTSMVNDLLGFTRTKLRGGMPIASLWIDLLAVCEAALADARAMHPDCDFRWETSGGLSGRFDSVRLQQLLTNLLGNAAQHGIPGQPIRFTAHGREQDVVLSVNNAGHGIPEEALERIFHPLVQLPSGEGDNAQMRTSLGLGLFIAREIARGHNGQIAVTSSDETGTTFTVTLPRGERD
jgi:signal transduction histidine kinase